MSKKDFKQSYLNFEDCSKQLPSENKGICKEPSLHIFDKKMLATHYYYECSICGYSPELDYNKEKFKACHESYQSWKTRRK